MLGVSESYWMVWTTAANKYVPRDLNMLHQAKDSADNSWTQPLTGVSFHIITPLELRVALVCVLGIA